ncbi:MAG: hypothetical protein HC924_12340, partial [Synechococcaceae cyanobacterium SM2_3_2]|nr:hypothetical protein [Synechococcaceae cyanobacterium SM2_3_2]
ANPNPLPNLPSPQSIFSFFLDPDDAQTFGNIDYMRTPKSVRKTFLGGKIEVVEEISAKEKRILAENGFVPPQPAASPPPESSVPTSSPTPSERRRSGSEMDMFRTMARDINRKG